MDRVTIHHQKNPPQLIRAKGDFLYYQHYGGWYWIRTNDPLLVRQMLSPTELITHNCILICSLSMFVTWCVVSRELVLCCIVSFVLFSRTQEIKIWSVSIDCCRECFILLLFLCFVSLIFHTYPYVWMLYFLFCFHSSMFIISKIASWRLPTLPPLLTEVP